MVELNYAKLGSDRRIGAWIGPSGGTTLGITDVHEPLAAEINNTGGTSAMQFASKTISWNDFDFGTQASETLNEPSLADAGSYTEFGQSNFGGGMSYFMPRTFNDDTNQHSIIFELTDAKYHLLDVAIRIDGDVLATAPAEDGDLVSVYRVQSGGDANPFTPGESKRRTVTYSPKSDFSHYTVVGDHTITAIPPASFEAGDAGRIRASQQGRDRTNALEFSSDDATVIQVFPGGFYVIVGAGTATVTIVDPDTLDSVEVEVTAS